MEVHRLEVVMDILRVLLDQADIVKEGFELLAPEL